ncbi:ligase-associated DNA damage response exonuclease [Wenxinia marina]|uniref:Putative exonuclease, DNA ligase-associated n=1 Tax=Wenxinia marina DSM 24838 TaxID=1123501 RepID=A0A0D0NHU3_9RHOB|nr:ligase-associated DNA damage response exonuclease [Wenxinia marina]KIQ67920.1 putative exonuclease, DNA ligase-associated [Wenxinia marina DSM 24838]GGL76263.1 DNA ligase-associated DEXH box helicase [Wenxinia marina]
MGVLSFTDRGIWCEAGGFYIDPWRPVAKALVTHGHSDHARWGMDAYLSTDIAAPVIRQRLGEDIRLDTIRYGEVRRIGEADVSFHPAGHVPGSAQIRIEVQGEVWVVSGDYKVVPDGLSDPFEPVSCHAFVSECTFGLPVFRWTPQDELKRQIDGWWAANRAAGRVSMLGAYALGKAQRLLAMVDPAGPILTHGAVENVNETLRAQGIALPDTIRVTPETNVKDYSGALVIATPSALGTPWARRFGTVSSAFASGWMALRGVRRRRAADRGFVVSDHADWDGLNAAIRETGAERVFVTHGYTSSFRRWLEGEGYDAGIVATEWEGDEAAEDAGVEEAS